MSAIINGTNGITFPTWTTGTRPASPAQGQAGYNTTIGAMETYTGSTWSTSDLPAPSTAGNVLHLTALHGQAQPLLQQQVDHQLQRHLLLTLH